MKSILLKCSVFIFLLSAAFASNAQRYKDKIFSSTDTTRDIKYGAATNVSGSMQDLMMDFYEPTGDVLDKRPLIVYVHGGGFTSGDKSELHIIGLCDQMAKRGYAVASINYRLDPDFDIYNSTADRRAMIDAMHDARAAVRFFRKNATTYKIDTNFIVIGGESAGAATSMLVNYVDEQSELYSYPMANPNNIEGNSGNPGFSSETDYTLCLCGLMLDTSAINTGDQPMLWMHGTEDNFVPYSLAQIITTRASNVGLEFTDYTYQGAVHCPWYVSLPNWLFYLDTTLNRITDFLYPKVTASVGLNELNSINIYPNPVKNTLTVVGLESEISIYDLLGKEVEELEMQYHSSDITIDVSALKPGMYFIRSEGVLLKFVKE